MKSESSYLLFFRIALQVSTAQIMECVCLATATDIQRNAFMILESALWVFVAFMHQILLLDFLNPSGLNISQFQMTEQLNVLSHSGCFTFFLVFFISISGNSNDHQSRVLPAVSFQITLSKDNTWLYLLDKNKLGMIAGHMDWLDTF